MIKQIVIIFSVLFLLSGCKATADRSFIENAEYVGELEIADRVIVQLITEKGEKLNLYIQSGEQNPMVIGQRYTIKYVDDSESGFEYMNQMVESIKHVQNK